MDPGKNETKRIKNLVLPPEIKQVLENSDYEENFIGLSQAKTLCIKSRESNYYLKIGSKDDPDNVQVEKDVMDWLQGKLPVPKIINFIDDGIYHYLLMSEIKGKIIDREMAGEELPQAISLFAKGLRSIHQVNVAKCPFDQSNRVKIENAYQRLIQGFVTADDLEPEYLGKDPGYLYELLVSKCPATEDLVFTHGDYCFENVILQEGQISGFIDWGRGGKADRYQDIALAVRTIRHFGGEWEQLFYQEYGLEDVDQDKIAFYILLDEFF